MSERYFNNAADKNKDFILEQLRKALQPDDRVLEIASGTGQHAAHFTAHMPDIFWQPSDLDIHGTGLVENLSGLHRTNLLAPLTLDINHWPDISEQFDALYSANCIHVIDWQSVENYIRGAAGCLKTEGALILYDPFKFDGAFTTESNEQFDAFLRERYCGGGIRDFEAIDALATKEGLSFQSNTQMPANNQFLIWRKTSAAK